MKVYKSLPNINKKELNEIKTEENEYIYRPFKQNNKKYNSLKIFLEKKKIQSEIQNNFSELDSSVNNTRILHNDSNTKKITPKKNYLKNFPSIINKNLIKEFETDRIHKNYNSLSFLNQGNNFKLIFKIIMYKILIKLFKFKILKE